MNPDLAAFLGWFGAEIVFGQVLIQRRGRGFELRHAADRAAAADSLQVLTVEALRPLAQFTDRGVFRPLKSAPNLRPGWRTAASDGPALELALNHLYPGALADWFAAQSDPPPVTSYRTFTGRQTGMYRITTHLDDALAGAAIRACCHADFCLKRRLWSVAGLAPDAPEQKSLIPCLEPCAVLLEFARKVARWEQQPSPPETAAQPDSPETDFDAANNPRRARFAVEKRELAFKPPVE
jgi:hypothetical protein